MLWKWRHLGLITLLGRRSSLAFDRLELDLTTLLYLTWPYSELTRMLELDHAQRNGRSFSSDEAYILKLAFRIFDHVLNTLFTSSSANDHGHSLLFNEPNLNFKKAILEFLDISSDWWRSGKCFYRRGSLMKWWCIRCIYCSCVLLHD